MNTSLISKQQYLNFVTDWKRRYRQISTVQRQIKRAIKNAHREHNNDDVAEQSGRHRDGKKIATELLKHRAEMKILARESYLAFKALRSGN